MPAAKPRSSPRRTQVGSANRTAASAAKYDLTQEAPAGRELPRFLCVERGRAISSGHDWLTYMRPLTMRGQGAPDIAGILPGEWTAQSRDERNLKLLLMIQAHAERSA